jgi:catechol 2,3-dioxygenase-like lactoylglutathione lyase family enzyme
VFDHVTIRVSNREASERFYDTVLGAIGVEKGYSEDWLAEWGDFSIAPANADHPTTRGLHIGFAAGSRELVDQFWRAGTEAGYRDDGAPGLRPQYRHDYYGAFLLDPDGNSAEAVVHGVSPAAGIDHMWIRVGDVEVSTRFYETIAPHAGFRPAHRAPGFQQFAGPERSFSIVDDDRVTTEHLHMAFPAPDNAAVDAFHAAATAAGYTDRGAPGERPEYHAGYYGAYVLDPDGNNVELVNHNR